MGFASFGSGAFIFKFMLLCHVASKTSWIFAYFFTLRTFENYTFIILALMSCSGRLVRGTISTVTDGVCLIKSLDSINNPGFFAPESIVLFEAIHDGSKFISSLS